MNLPEVNKRKSQSNQMIQKLKYKIVDLISDFEEEKKYKFESYEIDSAFLDMIQINHRSYLRAKFGNETE